SAAGSSAGRPRRALHRARERTAQPASAPATARARGSVRSAAAAPRAARSRRRPLLKLASATVAPVRDRCDRSRYNRAMKYWLMKSEPSAYSIDDLARDGATNWEGVRNFQARNFMRDEMKPGDKVLFYASSAEPSGVTGLAEVSRA